MGADDLLIFDAMADEEVLDLVCRELDRRLPPMSDLDAYVRGLRTLPVGLRSMAATYQLDVSITLDDLGWHFGNWHHHEYALETARGLRELGAVRAAEVFQEAYARALQHWDELGAETWMKWYHGSALETAVQPLDKEMWALFDQRPNGIMGLWIEYARDHPTLLRESARGTQ